MGFILRGPTDDWHLTLATELSPKAQLPKIQVDPDGYAEPLSSDDSTVLIRPRDVGGIQATMAAEGAASVASKVMETGPLTSGYYQQTKRAKKKAKDAAEAMKITAGDLIRLKIVDRIISEPAGGAHAEPEAAITAAGDVIEEELRGLSGLSSEQLKKQRAERFYAIGRSLS